MVERLLGGPQARRLVVLSLVGVLTACGSGGGGGGSDDSGGGNGGTPGGGPVEPVAVLGLNANRQIVDPGPTRPDIYLAPNDSEIIRINVRILAPSNPGGPCIGDDPSTPDVDEEDYTGCTLADLNGGDDPNDLGDDDGDDAFDPELSAIVSIPSEDLTLFSDEVEVRGASSRLSKQKSYKIEFDDNDGEYDQEDWFRMERLQLNKHPFDLSRIRNKLAFDLFRQVENYPSLRTQFVHVYVTDEANPAAGEQDAGLFTNVEYMDDKWARYHGQEEESNIFKTEEFSFRSLEETPELLADVDSDEFETVLESKGDDESSATLLDMLRAVNDESNNFGNVLNRYFNQDNFETWLSINILLANADSNTQNFYLYRPAKIDQFYFTPWDYDGAFDFYGQPGESAADRPRWQEGVSNWWLMPLVERYIRSGNIPSLTAKVNELFSGPVSEANIQALIDGYPTNEIVAISTSGQDAEFLPTGGAADAAAAMEAEIDRLPGTVPAARQQYLDALERPMPAFMGAEAVGSNSLRLTWDESFDIQNDSLFYDVRLSTSPTLATNNSACITSDDAMPILNGNVVSRNALTTGSVTVSVPGAGDYYMQVVVRDSKGYCQSAFDSYYDGATDTVYNGVYGFNFDGTTTTSLED